MTVASPKNGFGWKCLRPLNDTIERSQNETDHLERVKLEPAPNNKFIVRIAVPPMAHAWLLKEPRGVRSMRSTLIALGGPWAKLRPIRLRSTFISFEAEDLMHEQALQNASLGLADLLGCPFPCSNEEKTYFIAVRDMKKEGTIPHLFKGAQC
ncbi:hypothetical protein FKW77_001208 [Venturia effusa]|uniref:Uncharacterized protein n=1 Tax=Venturia effusa TaxID=50376 RepID=A0A517LPQ0_9PEZI|nr:hypothetical protein FKW77_001208 [Venturia effusa]